MFELKNAANDNDRFNLAEKYIAAHPERAYAQALMKICGK